MNVTRTRLSENGRVVIPAAIREQLGLQPGDDLAILVVDGEIRISSLRQAIRRAQALVRRYVPAEVSLVDELLAERRAEAARE
jgi:AbrB family looped-hinge helix DNA binding protein